MGQDDRTGLEIYMPGEPASQDYSVGSDAAPGAGGRQFSDRQMADRQMADRQMAGRRMADRQDVPGRQGRSILDSEGAAGDFRFKDILKLTKKSRKLQERIDKELECENRGGIVRVGHLLWNDLKRSVGAKVRTLNDLFDEQQRCVSGVCDGLYGLQSLCQKHYLALTGYRKKSNMRLSRMNSVSAGQGNDSGDLQREYRKVSDRLSALRKSDPEYPLLRERLAMMHGLMNQKSHHLNRVNAVYSYIDRIAVRVDSAARLLLHGKNMVDMLFDIYRVGDDFLTEALPSLNFERELMQNIEMLYDLNRTVSESIRQAARIEVKLENPRLLAGVAGSIPSSSAGSTADALDYLNSEFSRRV